MVLKKTSSNAVCVVDFKDEIFILVKKSPRILMVILLTTCLTSFISFESNFSYIFRVIWAIGLLLGSETGLHSVLESCDAAARNQLNRISSHPVPQIPEDDGHLPKQSHDYQISPHISGAVEKGLVRLCPVKDSDAGSWCAMQERPLGLRFSALTLPRLPDGSCVVLCWPLLKLLA